MVTVPLLVLLSCAKTVTCAVESTQVFGEGCAPTWFSLLILQIFDKIHSFKKKNSICFPTLSHMSRATLTNHRRQSWRAHACALPLISAFWNDVSPAPWFKGHNDVVYHYYFLGEMLIDPCTVVNLACTHMLYWWFKGKKKNHPFVKMKAGEMWPGNIMQIMHPVFLCASLPRVLDFVL